MFVFFLLYDVWLGIADGQLRYQAGGKIDYIQRKDENSWIRNNLVSIQHSVQIAGFMSNAISLLLMSAGVLVPHCELQVFCFCHQDISSYPHDMIRLLLVLK